MIIYFPLAQYFPYAIFVVMMLSTAFVAILAYRKPASARFFYFLNMAVLSTASISYFAIANHVGVALITTAAGGLREVSYARYIDWLVTTPFLLVELLLTSGMPGKLIFFSVFADVLMIVTGLIGAMQKEGVSKWVFFTFGCIGMLYVFFVIWQGVALAAKLQRHEGVDVNILKAYSVMSIWIIVLWTLYPIVWGFAEGANLLSVDAEMYLYGVLDVLAKPVFAGISLYMHESIPLRVLGLGEWDEALAEAQPLLENNAE